MTIQCLVFCGINETLYKLGNGNFLNLVELLEEFDSVMKVHLRRIKADSTWTITYLNNTIQDEQITLMDNGILNQIIKMVKKPKFNNY